MCLCILERIDKRLLRGKPFAEVVSFPCRLLNLCFLIPRFGRNPFCGRDFRRNGRFCAMRLRSGSTRPDFIQRYPAHGFNRVLACAHAHGVSFHQREPVVGKFVKAAKALNLHLHIGAVGYFLAQLLFQARLFGVQFRKKIAVVLVEFSNALHVCHIYRVFCRLDCRWTVEGGADMRSQGGEIFLVQRRVHP